MFQCLTRVGRTWVTSSREILFYFLSFSYLFSLFSAILIGNTLFCITKKVCFSLISWVSFKSHAHLKRLTGKFSRFYVNQQPCWLHSTWWKHLLGGPQSSETASHCPNAGSACSLTQWHLTSSQGWERWRASTTGAVRAQDTDTCKVPVGLRKKTCVLRLFLQEK